MTHRNFSGIHPNFLKINVIKLKHALLLFSRPIMSDSLQRHGLQHARPHHLPEFAQVHVHCISDAVQPSHPLTLSSSALNLSSIRYIPSESSVHIRWPKYWNFSFSISPPSEYLALISLKIDWFDPLAVQGTFRSLLHHHSSKASILWHSPFLTVQLSQPYMTTGNTMALTIPIFVGRVMSLLFNTLPRFVIAFPLRSNHLLISWLQSSTPVILEPKKRKSHYFHLFPLYLPGSNVARCHDLKLFNI